MDPELESVADRLEELKKLIRVSESSFTTGLLSLAFQLIDEAKKGDSLANVINTISEKFFTGFGNAIPETDLGKNILTSLNDSRKIKEAEEKEFERIKEELNKTIKTKNPKHIYALIKLCRRLTSP